MNPLASYVPIDRRIALARGQTLPDRARGTALFADISGFTPLADALAQSLGVQRAAEELTRQINVVYDALISQVYNHRGSVIGFAGDAITCWFEELADSRWQIADSRSQMADGSIPSIMSHQPSAISHSLSAIRAIACALAMQTTMRAFSQLAIKIGIATGPARRFLVGDPQVQLIDTLAGETIRQMAQAAELAGKGKVVLAPATIKDLRVIASEAKQSPIRSVEIASGENRPRNDKIATFAVVSELTTMVEPTPWDDLPDDALTEEQIRPWILSALYERIKAGQERFATELRAVTALFVQFEDVDYDHDENAGEKLDAYIRHAQRIVQRYEGSLIQLTIGDKGSFFYAVFGAPIAHDDDPYRAVQAALELQSPPSVIASEAKQSPIRESEIASSPTTLLAMTTRIGIAQGQMRVGAYGSATQRTYGAIGDATNLAARLMIAAPSGEIRCDYNVYRATNKRIAFETLPPVRVKGKAGLIRVYRPVEATRRVVSTTEIIGRRAEIAEIETMLDAAQGGATRVLVVEGEAGIGKSRLIDELKRLARERGLAGLVGNGQSIEQQTPYRAWRDVFNSYFELDSITDVNERRARVESLVPQLVPAHAQRLPVLNDVLGLGIPENDLTQSLDPDLRRQNVMTLLTALLCAWTLEHPLILILEDAHWLDGLSWQLALQVARSLSLANAPLLLVIVNRLLDENSAGQKAFAELRAMSITQSLSLGALAPDEIVALIANRLSVTTDALPAPLVELVQARANGNPFFAEELVFNLRDNRIIAVETSTEHAPRITITADLEQSARTLPDTLHGLILSRIDRLPPERQFILKVAAVVGRAFAFTPLHHVVNRYVTMIVQSLRDHLVALTTADFTFLESLEPDLTYVFKHIITQEAAYQTLLFSQRRELHRIVAEWYESSEQSTVSREQSPTVYYPLLAYHYRYAEDRAKERHYARLAGEQAASQYANDAAVSYLSRALELTPADDETTCRALLLAREAIYHIQGKRHAQVADLDALATLAQISGDSLVQAQVSLRRAKLGIETGDYAAALTRAQETISAAQTVHDQPLQVAGQIEWGRALARQAKYADAREHLAQGLALAQSAELRNLQAHSLHSLGTILGEEGNYALAQNYFEQALIIRRELSDRQGEGNALHSLGNIAIFQADYVRASEFYEQAITLFRKIGARTEEGVTLSNLGTVALYRGEYAQAASYYTEALFIARETGNRRSESNALGNLGIVARYREDYAQAIAYSEQALAIDRAIGHRQGAGRKLNSLGEATRLQGDYTRARAYYEQALAIARELGERRSESIALGNLGQVALGQQDYETALGHYEQALAIARELGDRDCIGYTLTGLGEAQAGVGRLNNAVTVIQEAIALRRQVGQLALLMESTAGLARIYLVQGKLAQAQAVMQEILAYLDQGRSLDAADEPLRILLTCYQVLAANQHPRAAEMLHTTFNRLCQRVAHIPDQGARRSVVENVPWYREIITAWAEGAQMTLDQAIDYALGMTSGDQ